MSWCCVCVSVQAEGLNLSLHRVISVRVTQQMIVWLRSPAWVHAVVLFWFVAFSYFFSVWFIHVQRLAIVIFTDNQNKEWYCLFWVFPLFLKPQVHHHYKSPPWYPVVSILPEIMICTLTFQEVFASGTFTHFPVKLLSFLSPHHVNLGNQ